MNLFIINVKDIVETVSNFNLTLNFSKINFLLQNAKTYKKTLQEQLGIAKKHYLQRSWRFWYAKMGHPRGVAISYKKRSKNTGIELFFFWFYMISWTLNAYLCSRSWFTNPFSMNPPLNARQCWNSLVLPPQIQRISLRTIISNPVSY